MNIIDYNNLELQYELDTIGIEDSRVAIEAVNKVIGFRIEKDDDSNIRLYGFRYFAFASRVRSYYSDSHPIKLVNPHFNEADVIKYREGKLPKTRVKLEYVLLPSFFMAEIYRIFQVLFEHYKDGTYAKILAFIEDNTWINGKTRDKSKPVSIDESQLSQIDSKFTLKDYQLKFLQEYPKLKRKSNLNGYILSLEQGMGKTLTATALALALKKDFILCVVPNSLKGNWQIELSEYIKAYHNKKVAQDEIYAIGESDHKFNKNKIKWLIINHESIDKAIPYLPKDRVNPMIILDESHFFRNIEANRAKALYNIKSILKSTDNIAISGTPIKANPAELAPALSLVDDSFTLEVAKIYARAFSVKSTNVKDLTTERFRGAIYRKTREEVKMNLPQKYEHDIPIVLPKSDRYLVTIVSNEIAHIYADILKKEQPDLNNYLTEYIKYINKYCKHMHKDNYIRWIKLMLSGKAADRELANETDRAYFNGFSKNYIVPSIPKDKLDYYKRAERGCLRLTSSAVGRAVGQILPARRAELFCKMYDKYEDKLIDSIEMNDKKTVIFTSIKEVAKHISARLLDAGVSNVLITGDSAKDRTAEVQQFKKDDDIRVIVATSQTLSTGVTLTEANQMYIFGAPWRDADYRQMSDRIYRIGQTTDVHINTMLLQTDEPNISTRMKNILKWSEYMFSAFIDGDEETPEVDSGEN